MLTLFLISSLIILVFPFSIILYSLICFTILTYYLSNLNIYFCSRLRVNRRFFLNDELSLFITLLLFFIMFLSHLLGRTLEKRKIMRFMFLMLLFVCFQVFNTSHLFSLYFFYEASLIPIFYIIIKWGSYPERSISRLMIVSYTLVFGVPTFIVIIYIYITIFTWYIPFIHSFKLRLLISLFAFLCFAVKLPIYGLHYWLPIAHVEAPTFGSVILARILLKLGGVGLYRLSPIIDLNSIKYFIISYFLIFTVYRTIVCCFQSDFKRLIAYSSVSHIIVIPFLIFSDTIISSQRLIIIILFHGIRSTLIFIRVGILYIIYSSRQLVLMRGLILSSPLIRIILILTFFYTLSAPPFPSFVAEVYFMISSYFLSRFIVYIFIPFIFLGIVYNLN